MLGHPPMQAGFINAPHQRVNLGEFPLELGGTIEDLVISFAAHGDLLNHSLPLAVTLCAIGSSHHRMDFLIGEHSALDPARMRVLAIDALGNGLSSSPSNTPLRSDTAFPRFTIRDMVRSQKALLEFLGVDEIDVIIGASMGGMQALQWGVSYPDHVRTIVTLTPMARTTPWAAAINEAARQSLLARLPNLSTSVQYSADVWDGWVPIMQLLAMRTPTQVDLEMANTAGFHAWLNARTKWWHEQNFHPVDWIYQSWAYDSHDVGTTPGFDHDTARALGAIKAPTLIVAPRLDLYNPVESARWAANAIARCNYLELDTIWGHLMASQHDPVSALTLNTEISRFLHNEGIMV